MRSNDSSHSDASCHRSLRVGIMDGDCYIIVVAGPCVIEGRESALRHGERLAGIARDLGVALVLR